MNLAQRLVHNLKAAFLLDQPLDAEIAQTNIRRIILMFYIMAPVHIAQIFIFWQALNRSTTSTTDTFITWRMGIIYAHSTMLVLIVTTVLLAHVIKRKEIENNRFGRAVPIIIAFSYLLFGATVCIIDQLVTPSIAPYLLVSVAVATVILVHPFFAGIIYISVYFFYYIFLPLTQLNSELLLSSRVNSLSAGGIGLGLSLILWRSNALSLFQKRAIEIQKHELEKKNIQLEQISRTDMLTGLYNRMCFTDFTEREVTRIKRTGETACLIFFDLDHFKNVNDHYGHPNGDVVLRRVSEVTKTQLRETDILARFGG
ncbi:MAG TPA: diguanylate cyclase, partial [Candidatus Limnocylindrales bacterium]|nr:diguanylate cyclase [Candidatus Limnocylindrales bacterium]